MDMNLFMDKLLAAAKAAGIETAEVYYQSSESFRTRARDGEIDDYEVSATEGLSLRGTVNGRMGYASTEAFDEEAVAQLIEGVKEAAALVETDEQDEIFAGEQEYPALEATESDIDGVSADEKLRLCLELEKLAHEGDERVTKADASMSTWKRTLRLRNSFGLNLTDERSGCMAYASAIAKDGESTGDGGERFRGHRVADLDVKKVAEGAVKDAIGQLHGEPVETGEYRVIFDRHAMTALLRTFSGVFSAESAQQNMSLLKGKEGTAIAAGIVTLMDDPLVPGGFGSRPFDAEGSASRTKAVIDKGVLTTLLHTRKTAKKQGVEPTGNASRNGYSGAVHVGPTNMFLKPGEKTLDELMAEVGEGLVITSLGGLHAGANPLSGDFSLLSNGYTIEGGKRGRAVERVTVAGNFYEVLKSIRAIGSDLELPLGGVDSPSVDVGTLKVSGK